MGYQYDLEFRPTGQHTNADGFSRLPLSSTTAAAEELVMGATVLNVQQIQSLPVTAKNLKEETGRDTSLSKVLRYTQSGWPREVPRELKPYQQRQQELVVERGCLLWGTKVVVPPKYRAQVLEELHAGHPGIVRIRG